MTRINLAIKHPSTGELMDGRMTFKAQHTDPRRLIAEGKSVVAGVAVNTPVSKDGDSYVDLAPSPAGWFYHVKISTEGWSDSETVRVPGNESEVDYGDLVRIDPLGPAPYSPEPWIYEWVRYIDSLGGVPGDSAKEILEQANDTSYTDAEFQ